MKRILLSAIAVALLTSPAFADPIDFSTQLLGTDSKPVPECVRLNMDRTKCEEEIILTLGWLARFALDQQEERTAGVPFAPTPLGEIVRRGTLSEKIKANDKLDLSVDEAKLIKDQIVKLNYKTGIKYQAIKLIDPKGVADGK